MRAAKADRAQETHLNAASCQVTLETLNDDCLAHICCYLNTLEQFKLYLALERSRAVIARHWRLHLRNFRLTKDDVKDFTNKQLLQLMQLISPHVEVLTFQHIDCKQFLLLGTCQFPKVHTLLLYDPYELTRCARQRYTVEIVDVIRHSFPNMHTLSASGFHLSFGTHFTSIENIKTLKMKFL